MGFRIHWLRLCEAFVTRLGLQLLSALLIVGLITQRTGLDVDVFEDCLGNGWVA